MNERIVIGIAPFRPTGIAAFAVNRCGSRASERFVELKQKARRRRR